MNLRKISQSYDNKFKNEGFSLFHEQKLMDVFNNVFQDGDETREITPLEFEQFFNKGIYSRILMPEQDVNYRNACDLINSCFGAPSLGEDDSILIEIRNLASAGRLSATLLSLASINPNPLDFLKACQLSFIDDEVIAALSGSNNPIESAEALRDGKNKGFVGTIEQQTLIVQHNAPKKLINALLSFQKEFNETLHIRQDTIDALIKHDNPEKICAALVQLSQKSIGLSDQLESELFKLEDPESFVEYLDAAYKLHLVYSFNIIQKDLFTHPQPKEFLEALNLLNRKGVSLDDNEYSFLAKAKKPVVASEALISLKELLLSNEIRLNILSKSNEEAIELISQLSELKKNNIQLSDKYITKIIESKNFKDITNSLIHLKKNNSDLLLNFSNIEMIINHPRPKVVVDTIKGLITLNNTITQNDLDYISKDIFNDWRSDKTPTFNINRLPTEFEATKLKSKSVQDAVKQRVASKYHESTRLMEQSVADLSLEYVRGTRDVEPPFSKNKTETTEVSIDKKAGPLLQYANIYSQRYLDLLKAYVHIDAVKGIPMIPVDAGQLKLHGFTSKDILKMQGACKIFTSEISPNIKSILKEGNNSEAFVSIIKLLTENQSLFITKGQKLADFPKETLEDYVTRVLILEKIEEILPHKEIDAINYLKEVLKGHSTLKWKDALALSKPDLEKEIGCALTDKQYSELIALKNVSFSLTPEQHKRMVDEFTKYDSIPNDEKWYLHQTHFLMHDFGHLSYDVIAEQLEIVGNLNPSKLEETSKKVGEDERLLMEIRHRIAGDSTKQQNSPGTLGSNPLAYLNVLEKGEPDNPEAEFRNKMFFVYMCNHFANAVVKDDEMVKDINNWLKENGKDWSLDMSFIATMRNRGAWYIPEIFRYGANAGLNSQYRKSKSDADVEKYYKEHPNISLEQAMSGTSDINAFHRRPLSSREYFNQVGELRYQKNDPRNERQLNFGTGAAIFDLARTSNTFSESTNEYLDTVDELGIPVCAGISGTLDQSTAMAGLVGLGVSEDMSQRQYELETIRMAYLAFMVPGGDHTVHEIMQSGTTYGLPYVAGPGYENYIFPRDGVYVKSELQALQQKRGSNLPEYYLSEDYVNTVVQEVENEMLASQKDVNLFIERLNAAKANSLNPELAKKLSDKDYQEILNFFSNENNKELQDSLLLLKPGDSIRFSKESTQLPRTINIVRSSNGEYKLIAETKRKLQDNTKDLDMPVARGAIKTGKPSWRLDVQEEYFGLTMSVGNDHPHLKEYIEEIKKESELSRSLGENSTAICATETGQIYEKNGRTKITVYSPKAIGTLDSVLESLSDNREAKEQLIDDLLKGVKAMHDAGMVHQDLKPQNLLVYKDINGKYSLKIADFGEAKKHGNKSEYAAGPKLYQSPEMAYYYTNPYETDKANKEYGETYYAKKIGILGRVVIDSKEGQNTYPVDEKKREQFKSPDKSNDMWAVGLLIHYIQYNCLPQNMHDLNQAKKDPLLKGLLDIDRENRIDIDKALILNNDLKDRIYEKREPGQRYYIGINLPTTSDGRGQLGDDITSYLKELPSVTPRDRSQWHMTIGWLENIGSEDTPISNDNYQKILKEIAPIINKYNALEFKISQLENWKGHSSVHVQLQETTNQLELLRQEIQEKIREVAPDVEFKFASPHIVVGSTNEYITQDKLPTIDDRKTYQVSKIDMIYHDDKQGKNVISDSFSTLPTQKSTYSGTFFKKPHEEVGKELGHDFSIKPGSGNTK